MPQYRYTLLMQKKTGEPAGISERWDMTVGSDAGAKAIVGAMVNQRAAFLPSCWNIVAVRIGKLSSVLKTGGVWKLKQVSLSICLPQTSGTNVGVGDVDGTAVYYQWHYEGKPGRVSVRLHRPTANDWWKGGPTFGLMDQTGTDPKIIPWSRWLAGNGHTYTGLNTGTGAITAYPLECIKFERSATRKVGRPFGQRRGRRFAHRVH